MQTDLPSDSERLYAFLVVRPEPPGQHTVAVVGLPEIQATAPTREEAIERVRAALRGWLASGQLVPIELPHDNPWIKYAGWAKDDPDYSVYLEELARARQEDLERTLQEEDQACSNSSSTPTT
jgi:predicted RNase H-like HicB family nuclease